MVLCLVTEVMCSDSGVIVSDSDNDVMINIINTVDT